MTLPTGASIAYAYQQVGFDTGELGGAGTAFPVQFSVMNTRRVTNNDGSDGGLWSYNYQPTGITPGSNGATTAHDRDEQSLKPSPT